LLPASYVIRAKVVIRLTKNAESSVTPSPRRRLRRWPENSEDDRMASWIRKDPQGAETSSGEQPPPDSSGPRRGSRSGRRAHPLRLRPISREAAAGIGRALGKRRWDRGGHETGTILLATRAGRIVGCVSVQRKADFAYAGRLAVEPLERGGGIGRALMAQAEALARQMGADRLRVDVRLALAQNRAFFRSLGFAEGGHRRHPGFASPTYAELEKILI